MNERIKQLAEQCHHRYSEHNINLEKFAELIVRECAQFVEDKFDFIGEEIIVKEKMLEHFGVEE
jgi:hypothetical protein